MATAAYFTWVAEGSAWDLARPVRELRNWAEANAVPVLGTIGNEAHLTSGFPEDHTPFSVTAWPVPLPRYVVTAIDLGDVDGLGWAILAMARRGKLPWLKYMNVQNRHYVYSDGFTEYWPNGDAHIHLSVFSDDLDTSIEPFDPWEDSGMELETATVRRPRDGAQINLLDTIAWTEERTYRIAQQLEALTRLVRELGAPEAASAAEIAPQLEIRAKP